MVACTHVCVRACIHVPVCVCVQATVGARVLCFSVVSFILLCIIVQLIFVQVFMHSTLLFN